MKCTIHQETHVGRRAANQDRLGHWRTPESVLLVVADGMGGHAHGEVAAELTLRHIAAAFKRDAQPRLANPDLFLFRAVGRSHGMLLREAQALGLTETPRTSLKITTAVPSPNPAAAKPKPITVARCRGTVLKLVSRLKASATSLRSE